MQRQKTIAKWLAIILLLTAVIACYIVISTVTENKNSAPDIAGANGSGDSSDADVPDDGNTQPKPVYSTFPRSAQETDGLLINHVGGKDNDVFLDSIYFAGRRCVFFFSASVQYDVKACGIHIAEFKDGTLISTTRIAEADETFISASIAENGLLVITKNAGQTKLRLLNGSLGVICESTCPLYSDYKLYITSAGARLYTADSGFVYANTITSSLDVKRSNFVYPIADCRIFRVAGLGANDVLFVQSAQGAGFLTYSANTGFDCKSELANGKLMQILPLSVNGKPNFAVLAKCDGGITMTALDENLQQSANYLFKGAKTAVATIAENNNICVIADGAKATFCSHLELQSSAPINFTDYSEQCVYTAIDGENEYIFVSEGSSHTFAKLNGNDVITLFKFTGKNVKATRDIINGKSEICVQFDGNANNSFGSMCFGANDVFSVSVLTTKDK